MAALEIDGVFDIETAHWDQFVVGGVLLDGPKGGDVIIDDWRTEDDLVDEILAVEGTIWGHNAGCYDSLWLLEHVRRRGKRAGIICAGSRIVALEIGDLTVRDSYALIPFSLDEASGIGKIRKEKTGLACRCGRDCGGYCAISRDMRRDEMGRLKHYLEHDLRALRSTLESLFDYADNNNIILAGTVGASAYKTAAAELGLPPADWHIPRARMAPSRAYAFARSGYGGGRTQSFRPDSPAGERWDLVSAYPAALATIDLPCGEPTFWARAGKPYREGLDGIFQATVDVPRDTFIPPLPYRLKDRIAYPTGSFAGAWAGNELRYAESVGVRVLNIASAIVWDDSRPLLRDFCRRIWGLRDAAGPKTALGKWLKWLANSLTGKCAQRPTRQAIELNPSKLRACPASAACYGVLCSPQLGCCHHRCYGTCGRHEYLDREGHIAAREVYHLAKCAHVHWAAYLTAHTRLTLHAQLIDDGLGGISAVYCDTDSCFAEAPRTKNIGHQLGQWKPEGPYRNMVTIAPKTYRFEAVTPAGERALVARSKGIPDAERHFDALLAGEAIVNDRGVSTFRTAVARGGSLFSRKNIARHALRRDYFGDRLLIPEGITVPLPVERLLELKERERLDA